MKILTKKKQEKLLFDIIDLYNYGSDALKAIGTQQNDKFDARQVLERQKRMIEAAMDAADILQGFVGTCIVKEVDKRKREMEAQQGFPLKLKEKKKEE